jgi:uncharacterized protein YutD
LERAASAALFFVLQLRLPFFSFCSFGCPFFVLQLRARSAKPVSAGRQRERHVGHFAFMRSVVQSLDARES